MSEVLCIDIKKLDDGGFHFYQTGLIHKVLEATWMEHCTRLPTPTKVEAALGIDYNIYEANKDWPNSYASVIPLIIIVNIHFCVFIRLSTIVKPGTPPGREDSSTNF